MNVEDMANKMQLLMKRPAAAVKDEKRENEEEKEKEQQKGEAEGIEHGGDKSKPPPCPGFKKCAPVRWGGCKIYTSEAAQQWRIILRPGDKKDVAKPFTLGWEAVLDVCRQRGAI